MNDPDVVVIGSGPNGLSAAVALAQAGASVLVLERHAEIGGGTRTAELTLPGFRHDFCSAVHPMGILSPYWRTLPLHDHGLKWILPPASVAHPLDDGTAVMLRNSISATMDELGIDGQSYRRLVEPFVNDAHELLGDALGPLSIPRHPILMSRFGIKAIRSAKGLAKRFRGERACALFAGCAGHSILPLDHFLTAAIGLMFLVTGHVKSWPVAAGGSHAISHALASLLLSLGGQIQTNTDIRSATDVPPAKLWMFDTDPHQLADIAGPQLPDSFVRRLKKYKFGPGAFKVDWALSESIPWRDPRCLEASTVHVGGTFEQIAASEAAMWNGIHSDQPFVLLCQQSEFDSTRAPVGQQTGYAYCHVPANSDFDMTDRIENQIERFAPGFKDCILERHTTNTSQFAQYNPNFVGGAITGGVADYTQLFTRPVARINPYTTPNKRVMICSASTPPGGGVHGMCGYHAAQTAIKRIKKLSVSSLAINTL